MNRKLTKFQALAAIKLLELEESHLAIVRAETYMNALENYETFKEVAVDNYKRLAMEKHPDRGGSLEEMKELNAAMDIIKRIPPPPPPQPRPRQFMSFGSFSSGTSSTTTSYSYSGATIRIKIY